MPYAVQRFESKQYDGTNGADLVNNFVQNCSLTSDDGVTLKFLDSNYCDQVLPVGSWVIRSPDRNYLWAGSDAEYQLRWVEVGSP